MQIGVQWPVDICPCSKDRHDIGLLRESPEVVNSLIIFDNVCDLISNAKRRLIPGFFPKSIMLFPLSELAPFLTRAPHRVAYSRASTSLAPRKPCATAWGFSASSINLIFLEFSKTLPLLVEPTPMRWRLRHVKAKREFTSGTKLLCLKSLIFIWCHAWASSSKCGSLSLNTVRHRSFQQFRLYIAVL